MFPCEDIIKSGKCHSDCCGIVPMNRLVFKMNKSHYQVKVKKLIKDSRITVYPITEDGLCIFLNRKTYRCSIYSQRPLICRNYGKIDGLPCPYLTQSGKKRTKADTECVKAIIDLTVDDRMERLKSLCTKKM